MATRTGLAQYGYNDASSDSILSGLGDNPFNVTAGQAVVGAVAWRGVDVNITAIGDTGGVAVYTLLTKRKHPTQDLWIQLFYTLDHPGGSDLSWGVSFSAATTFRSIVATSYNVAATATFVKEVWGSATSASSVTTSDSLHADSDGVIFVGGTSWFNWVPTAGTDYALVINFGDRHASEDRLVGVGDYSPSMNDTNGTDHILIAAALIQDEAPTTVEIDGTGSFSTSLSVSQTGSGQAGLAQSVSGTASFAVTLNLSQTGNGLLPQIVFNTGSTISWLAGNLSITQSGVGTLDDLPATGTADFAAILTVAMSGSGLVVLPPQNATGAASFAATLATAQIGTGFVQIQVIPFEGDARNVRRASGSRGMPRFGRR